MKLLGWHPWCDLKWETLEYKRVGLVGSYEQRRVTCTECAYSSDVHYSKSYDENWQTLKGVER